MYSRHEDKTCTPGTCYDMYSWTTMRPVLLDYYLVYAMRYGSSLCHEISVCLSTRSFAHTPHTHAVRHTVSRTTVCTVFKTRQSACRAVLMCVALPLTVGKTTW